MTLTTRQARVKGLQQMSTGALIEQHSAITVNLTDAIDRAQEEDDATHDMAALLRRVSDELRRRGYRYYNGQGWQRKK
jgi:hypothetical protein